MYVRKGNEDIYACVFFLSFSTFRRQPQRASSKSRTPINHPLFFSSIENVLSFSSFLKATFDGYMTQGWLCFTPCFLLLVSDGGTDCCCCLSVFVFVFFFNRRRVVSMFHLSVRALQSLLCCVLVPFPSGLSCLLFTWGSEFSVYIFA